MAGGVLSLTLRLARGLSALAPSDHVHRQGRLPDLPYGVHTVAPNESSLCTTAKPWFIQQFRTIARSIQAPLNRTPSLETAHPTTIE